MNDYLFTNPFVHPPSGGEGVASTTDDHESPTWMIQVLTSRGKVKSGRGGLDCRMPTPATLTTRASPVRTAARGSARLESPVGRSSGAYRL